MRVGSNFRLCLLDLNRDRITPSWLFGLSSLLRGRALSPGAASFGPSASALRDEPDVILNVTAGARLAPCACTQRHARNQRQSKMTKLRVRTLVISIYAQK